MWVMTNIGFFSIVQKEKDKKAGMLTVRARVLDDLEALRQHTPAMGKVVTSENSDYRYRVRVKKENFAEALGNIAKAIDYSNFKDEVLTVQGQERANTYLYGCLVGTTKPSVSSGYE